MGTSRPEMFLRKAVPTSWKRIVSRRARSMSGNSDSQSSRLRVARTSAGVWEADVRCFLSAASTSPWMRAYHSGLVAR